MGFTIEDFKSLNSGNENLGHYDWKNWNLKKGPLPEFVFDEKKIQENFKIAQQRQIDRDNYDKEFRVGDVIILPNNEKLYITYVWDENVQTSFGANCHISKGGYMSYSGGLDPGVKIKDLKPTKEKEFVDAWFFEGEWARAHSSVQCKIETKVWRLKKGADLSGVPRLSKK